MTGTLGHPNSLAELLVLTLPLTAWLAWHLRGPRRDLVLWALALHLVTIVLVGARVAWLTTLLLALLAGPLILCLRRLATRARRCLGRLLALTPILVASAGFLVLLLAPASAGQVETLVSRLRGRRETLQTRQELWQSALAMIADRPLLGWGPDTFVLVYPAHRSPELDARENAVGRDDVAHDLLLGEGVNAGLAGLAAYLAVLAAIALLMLWTSNVLLFVFGRTRVTTDWMAWIAAGAALGLFSAPA